MKQKDLHRIKEWFSSFVRSYDSTDNLIKTNLRYKEDHSYEVAKICDQLAMSLGLPEEQTVLAEAIGLLHDVGRFPQFYLYKTFQDSQSENHACLGVRILKEQTVLDFLEQSEQDIINQAIHHHNFFKLPAQPETVDLFSKIIRDSDKLDIFRFIQESEKNRLTGNSSNTVHLELDSSSYFSDTLIDSILNRQCCFYSDLKTVHDFKLLQLSWVFDINFPRTFQLLKEKNYINELFLHLPKNQKIQQLIVKVNQYMESNLILQKSPEISAK